MLTRLSMWRRPPSDSRSNFPFHPKFETSVTLVFYFPFVEVMDKPDRISFLFMAVNHTVYIHVHVRMEMMDDGRSFKNSV